MHDENKLFPNLISVCGISVCFSVQVDADLFY
jgi:hypothetical protein